MDVDERKGAPAAQGGDVQVECLAKAPRWEGGLRESYNQARWTLPGMAAPISGRHFFFFFSRLVPSPGPPVTRNIPVISPGGNLTLAMYTSTYLLVYLRSWGPWISVIGIAGSPFRLGSRPCRRPKGLVRTRIGQVPVSQESALYQSPVSFETSVCRHVPRNGSRYGRSVVRTGF